MKSALIVCIGNNLAADDAVGLAIFKKLENSILPPGTQYRFLGTGGISLIDALGGEDILVVVDAVQFGSFPGTVHVLDWEQLPPVALRPVSSHGIGIRETIEVAKRLFPEQTPRDVYLVGIEGKCFNQFGAALSTEVADALEFAVSEVLYLVKSNIT
jgi:hydrogenase maturation protease